MLREVDKLAEDGIQVGGGAGRRGGVMPNAPMAGPAGVRRALAAAEVPKEFGLADAAGADMRKAGEVGKDQANKQRADKLEMANEEMKVVGGVGDRVGGAGGGGGRGGGRGRARGRGAGRIAQGSPMPCGNMRTTCGRTGRRRIAVDFAETVYWNANISTDSGRACDDDVSRFRTR